VEVTLLMKCLLVFAVGVILLSLDQDDGGCNV
jgi:hypothetical protein